MVILHIAMLNYQRVTPWLLVSNIFIFHNIWDVILPIDELIFFKMVIAPPTSTYNYTEIDSLFCITNTALQIGTLESTALVQVLLSGFGNESLFILAASLEYLILFGG